MITLGLSEDNRVHFLQFVYACNVLVCAPISFLCLYEVSLGRRLVFSDAAYVQESGAIQLVGCWWLAICISSFIGIFYPFAMRAVFILQLLYKFTWLVASAASSGQFFLSDGHPKEMNLTFLIWIIAMLPISIYWSFSMKEEKTQ